MKITTKIAGVTAAVVATYLITQSLAANSTSAVLPDKAQAVVTLTESNVLSLNNEVNADTMAALMSKALELDSKVKSNDPLYLVLYTPGGDIQAGLEAIEFLNSLNRPVHTVTIFSASMGFQMVQGLGNRYITHFGTLMAHKAKGSFQGEFPGQLDSRYNYYLKKLGELDRITASKSRGKLTVDSFKALYENEYWIDGFDAVDAGLADGEVIVKCDQSLNGTHDDTIEFFGMKITLVFSNCPMITSPVAVGTKMATNKGTMTVEEFVARHGVIERPNFVTSITTDIPIAIMDKGVTIEMIQNKVKEIKTKYSKRPEVVRY